MVLEHEIVEARESAKPDIVSKALAAASKEKKLLPTIYGRAVSSMNLPEIREI